MHQSSIKCLSTVQLSNEEVLLATAGDDGALAFSKMTLSKIPTEKTSSQLLDRPSQDHQNPSPLTSTLLIPKAHASAVTALQYIASKSIGLDSPKQYRFVTSGNDQRLKTWLLTIEMHQPGVEGFAVSKEQNVATAIADVSSMDLAESGGAGIRGAVVVAGIGLETWSTGCDN